MSDISHPKLCWLAVVIGIWQNHQNNCTEEICFNTTGCRQKKRTLRVAQKHHVNLCKHQKHKNRAFKLGTTRFEIVNTQIEF